MMTAKMDLWSSPSPAPAYRGMQNGHSSRVTQPHWNSGQSSSLSRGGRDGSLPGFIPEEEGQQQLYPSSRHRHQSMWTTPPLQYLSP